MAAKKKATKKTSAPAKKKVQPGKKTVLVPTPEVGEIVKFYPAAHDTQARSNYADQVPAIVTNVFGGGLANLRVFQDGNENPLWRTSIKHMSVAEKEDSCWDFRN